MRLRTATIGLMLAGYALASGALTLGRARGAAWIGQPLELTVTAQLEPGQAANSLCAEADVFYADSKIEAGRVQISVEAAQQIDTATVRIISPVLVDEPVVTVYVRAGCSAKTTRRYVLLADFPSESVSAPVRAPETAPVPTFTPVATTPPEPKPSGAPVAATAAAPTPPPPPKAATPRPTPASKSEGAPTPPREPVKSRKPAAEPKEPKEAKATSGRARLKLDPIENLAERIKTLEATTSAAPLEEMVRDSQRIQELQTSVKALLDQAAKNEASLLAMRERMDRAESDRVPAWLVYVLLVLVAICAAAIAVLWNRRDPSAWRSGLAVSDNTESRRAEVSAAQPIGDTAEGAIAPQSDTVKQASLKKQGRPAGNTIFLDSQPFESYVTVNAPQDASASDLIAFGDKGSYHPNFNSNQMIDLRLQSEFFTKLGKTDEAIEALEQRIRENSKDCPLIFLELLRVANQHSLKTDFRQFRDEIRAVFNVNVPEFALFRDEGRDLEAYPGVLSHITQLWPASQVMDVIEACILITPGEKNAERFDLAAFRDLIMLHGLVYHHTFQGKTADMLNEMDSEHVSLDL